MTLHLGVLLYNGKISNLKSEFNVYKANHNLVAKLIFLKARIIFFEIQVGYIFEFQRNLNSTATDAVHLTLSF